jgi:simple sugar transport system substrate-binding protein/basic membrane protein A
MACGGERSVERAGTFRAALLTSGPVSDAGWHAGAYEGLLLIEDSLGADVSHQQTRTPVSSTRRFWPTHRLGTI